MRRNGVGIGARKEKGRSEKIVKRGGRKEIGDRIFRSLDVCGSQSVLILLRKRTDSSTFLAHPTRWLASWLAGWWLAASNVSGTPKCFKKHAPLARKCVENAYP